MDWLTLATIFFGPLLAILVGQLLAVLKERRDRRLWVFKTLMRTRRNPTSPDHVGALNLIEIEFSKDEKIMLAFKELFEHLGTDHNRRKDELVSKDDSVEESVFRDKIFYQRIVTERATLLAKLLH